MKSIKVFILLLLVATLGGATASPRGYKITGTIKFPYEGKVYLGHVDKQYRVVDSAQVVNGQFTLQGTIDKVDCYSLRAKRLTFNIDLMLEPGADMNVTVETKDNYTVDVISGGEQPLMNKYHAYEMTTANEKDFVKREREKAQFVIDNPRGLTAIIAATECLMLNYRQMEQIFALIDTVSFTDSYYFNRLRETRHELTRKWMVGKQAPAFTAHDAQGNAVSLSDFKGKYILIDFWASWCAPCREKTRIIVKNLDKLKAQGIVMLSVSMDDNKQKWIDAAQADGLSWVSLSDLKGLKKSAIAADYRLTNMPTIYLINPAGVIVSQNPSLYEIFKGNLNPESDVR